jgi:hypothetical protein
MGLYLGSVHAHLSGHDNLGLIKKTDRLLAWVDDWKAYLQQTENNTIPKSKNRTIQTPNPQSKPLSLPIKGQSIYAIVFTPLLLKPLKQVEK